MVGTVRQPRYAQSRPPQSGLGTMHLAEPAIGEDQGLGRIAGPRVISQGVALACLLATAADDPFYAIDGMYQSHAEGDA